MSTSRGLVGCYCKRASERQPGRCNSPCGPSKYPGIQRGLARAESNCIQWSNRSPVGSTSVRWQRGSMEVDRPAIVERGECRNLTVGKTFPMASDNSLSLVGVVTLETDILRRSQPSMRQVTWCDGVNVCLIIPALAPSSTGWQPCDGRSAMRHRPAGMYRGTGRP
jgi:hypothetical protein